MLAPSRRLSLAGTACLWACEPAQTMSGDGGNDCRGDHDSNRDGHGGVLVAEVTSGEMSGWFSAADTSDGVHPYTTTGADELASRWFDAIADLH